MNPQSAAGILPADQSEKSTAGKMPAAPWRWCLSCSKSIVPMHAEKRMEAFLEPRSSGRESAHSQRNQNRLTSAATRRNRFGGAMRAQNSGDSLPVRASGGEGG